MDLNRNVLLQGAPYLLLLFGVAWGSSIAIGDTQQQNLHLAGELQTDHRIIAFGGTSVEVTFLYIAPASTEVEFAADFYQRTTSIAVPVSKGLDPDGLVSEPGSVVTEVRYALEMPEVERETTFFLRLLARPLDSESWSAVGRITWVAHPRLAWERLQKRAGVITIRGDEGGAVFDFLKEQGFDLLLAHPSDSRAASGLSLWKSSTRDEAIRIEYRPDGVDVFMHLLKDPATDPGSQLTLYQTLEAAIAGPAGGTLSR